MTIYVVGGRISPKGGSNRNKLLSYACGEKFPSVKLQFNLESFFIYAMYFLVFDVLAFVLATSLGILASEAPISLLLNPIIYVVVVFAAIWLLPPGRRLE